MLHAADTTIAYSDPIAWHIQSRVYFTKKGSDDDAQFVVCGANVTFAPRVTADMLVRLYPDSCSVTGVASFENTMLGVDDIIVDEYTHGASKTRSKSMCMLSLVFGCLRFLLLLLNLFIYLPGKK